MGGGANILVVAMVMVLSLDHSSVVSGIDLETVHVHITNQLEPGKSSLTVHCKSKNDDLGVHPLVFGQTYNWSFRNNFWDTTLFFCHFEWHKSGGQRVSASFDIYKATRDEQRCTDKCEWLIEETGLYSLNRETHIWENLYNWPN